MINFDYVKASSQKAAIDALNKDASSQFIAGGTNLVDLMKRGVTAPQKLIDITTVPLKNIEQQKGSIRIGALALNSEFLLLISIACPGIHRKKIIICREVR
jgi:xanthine dehydrogenase YagS FAD-binding subunit